MSNFMSMVQTQAELLVYLLAGVLAQKLGIVSGKGRAFFIDYLLKIALPCMIFQSFNQSIGTSELLSATFILLISFLMCMFSVLLGKLLWKKSPPHQRSVLEYGTLISNAGFAGLPLTERAYGPVALFYASIYVIPTRIFMWSAGISLFASSTSKKERMRQILLNPGIIAVALGMLRMLLALPLPAFFDHSIKNIGSSTTAISMIIVGSILSEVPMRSIWDKRAFLYSAVRLILIPGLALIILKLFRVDTLAIAAAVTLSGMPAGATTSLLAEKYGADHMLASKCVFVSTVLSIIVVPVMALFI